MKKVLGGLAALVVIGALALVGLVATQPDTIELSRSVEVAASPADVHPYAHDLRKVNEWSPWRDRDPNLTQAYSDPTTGVGAWYSWDGNDDVGEGKQTVTVAEDRKVVHDLHFIRPFDDHAEATIEWTDTDAGTTVTWSFAQPASFGTKAANLFMDIEGMLGKDFEQGLADLKPLVEAAAEARRAEEKAAAEALAAEQAEAAEAEAEAEAGG